MDTETQEALAAIAAQLELLAARVDAGSAAPPPAAEVVPIIEAQAAAEVAVIEARAEAEVEVMEAAAEIRADESEPAGEPDTGDGSTSSDDAAVIAVTPKSQHWLLRPIFGKR